MSRASWVAAALIVIVMVGYSLMQMHPKYAGAIVTPSQTAPDLVLTGANGTHVSLARSDRRLTLVAFGYTSCPDVCPTTLSDWTRVRRALGADTACVRFVWVSADWRHDGPEQAGAFAARFDPSFAGVTADSLTLLTLLPVFMAVARYVPGEGGGPAVFSHSAYTYLLDETGRIALEYEFDARPAVLAADVKRMVRERKLTR